MEKLCSSCKKEIKPGGKFCGFCGRPVEVKVRNCVKCNEVLEDMENFCPMCGEKYEDSPKGGTLVSIHNNQSLRFLRGTGEEEKKAIRKLRKEASSMYGRWDKGLFLYDKDERVTFIRREDSSFIEGYSYDNTDVPFRKYTVSNEVDHVWKNSMYAQVNCYFFHTLDAFFAWDSYIFISVYEGKIVWSAADIRDVHHLPSQSSDVTMSYGGEPKLELLPNGNIRSEHFYNNAECKLVKGVLIPIQEK